MHIIDVPFEQLKISKFNMRYREPAPDISDILPTVKEKGILLPLLIRAEDGGYGVVYGRRRWYCAKTIIAEQGSFKPLPCIVMDEGDDADAIEASLIENLARRNADPMTEHETFVRLIKEGRTIEGIGQTYGLSPAGVKQRLALGNLLSKIREGYRQGDIDDDTVCHLTMASKTQQSEWLKLYEDKKAPHGRQLKQWLFGGQAISTNIAIFPLDEYKGQIVTDLFGEVGYFKDADLFWQMQNTAVAAKAEAMRESGWTAVHVLEIGQQFNTWDFEKTTKSKGGHVYITTSHHGVMEAHDGWLTKKEARQAVKRAEAEKTGKAKDDAKDKAPADPTITGTMQSYLDLHRHAIVRLGLIGNPLVAFRLLIAHAIASSGNWHVKSDPQVARSPEVKASIAAAPAQVAFEAERKAVMGLLKVGDHSDTEAVFARLLKLADADVLRVAVFVMADTLAVGGDSVDAVGTHLGLDARAYWQPDDIFFELVRDRSSLNAMLAEVGGKPLARANIAEKGKTQKAIIRDLLMGANGRTRVEGWLPGWMAFPFRDLGEKPRAARVRVEPERIAAE